MIEPSLSLLVDGKVITEAIVFDREGNHVCYPCFYELINDLVPIAKFLIELTSLGICEPLKSYLVIANTSSRNITLIPIPNYKVVTVVTHVRYDVEKVVRDLIDAIVKLLKFREDSSRIIGGLSRSLSINEVRGALLLSPDGSIIKSYGSLSINQDLIERLVGIHNELYSKLRFRAIKFRLSHDRMLVIAPMVRFKAISYIVIAEVRKDIPVSTIVRHLLRTYR